MIVKDDNGQIVGEIVLWMAAAEPCPYPGPHGYLPYAFIPTGQSKPSAVVCDEHCHQGGGIYSGLLAKVNA